MFQRQVASTNLGRGGALRHSTGAAERRDLLRAEGPWALQMDWNVRSLSADVEGQRSYRRNALRTATLRAFCKTDS